MQNNCSLCTGTVQYCSYLHYIPIEVEFICKGHKRKKCPLLFGCIRHHFTLLVWPVCLRNKCWCSRLTRTAKQASRYHSSTRCHHITWVSSVAFAYRYRFIRLSRSTGSATLCFLICGSGTYFCSIAQLCCSAVLSASY